MPKYVDSVILNWRHPDRSNSFEEHLTLYDSSSSDNDDTTISDHLEETVVDTTPTFSFILKRAYITILYCSLEELGVLKRFSKEAPDPEWKEFTEYRTIEEKYKVPDDTYIMGFSNARKGLRDTCTVFNIIAATYKEFVEDAQITSLERAAFALAQEHLDEYNLMEEIFSNCKLLNQLKSAVIKETTDNSKSLETLSDEVNDVKQEYEDVLAYCRKEYRYNDEWESSRLQQKTWAIMKETQNLQENIDQTNTDISNENRVHDEIKTYCVEHSEDINNQIEYWRKTYDEELEQRDSDLIKLRMDQEVLTQQHIELDALFIKHRQEMDDWIEYRRLKRIADEILRLKNVAALKIQAWWRGTMYRKSLGPYSKKKKKKKGKGKDKKKNK